MMSQSKKAQMKIVRETGFAMLDAALYLDTHPKDEKAMDYFNKYQTLYREACKEYEACSGLGIRGHGKEGVENVDL